MILFHYRLHFNEDLCANIKIIKIDDTQKHENGQVNTYLTEEYFTSFTMLHRTILTTKFLQPNGPTNQSDSV